MSALAEAAHTTDRPAQSAHGVTVSVGWLIAARISTMLVSLAATAVLARLLTPADFGLMVLVMLAANLAAAVIEGGISVPLVQRVVLTPAHIHMALLLATVTSLLLTAAIVVVILVSERWSGDGAPRPVVLFALCAIPMRCWSSVFSAIMQRHHRFRQSMRIGLASATLGNAVPSVVLAWAHFGVWSLAVGLVFSSLVEAVLTGRAAQIRPLRWPPLALARDFGKAATAGGAMQVTNWAALNSANIIVSMVFGPSALGLFSRAAALVSLVKDLIGTSLSRVLLPAFAGLQDASERQRRAFERTLNILLPILAGASVLIVLHAEAIVLLVLGDQWRSSIVILQLLAAGLLPRISYKIAETLIIARGDYWAVCRRQFVYFALLISCAGLGALFGLPGVAAGVTVATTLYYALALTAASRAVKAGTGAILRSHVVAFAFAALVSAADLVITASCASLGFWPAQLVGASLTGIGLSAALALRSARILELSSRSLFRVLKLRKDRVQRRMPATVCGAPQIADKKLDASSVSVA